MTDELPHGGKNLWVPEGAYVVYPIATVVEMFGHGDASATRSMMARYGYPRQINGWPVDEVEYVLDQRDPAMVKIWRDRKRRKEEQGNG